MTIENTFKDLVDCYFSVNYNEKIDFTGRYIDVITEKLYK